VPRHYKVSGASPRGRLYPGRTHQVRVVGRGEGHRGGVEPRGERSRDQVGVVVKVRSGQGSRCGDEEAKREDHVG
jgi:hypothetical protein